MKDHSAQCLRSQAERRALGTLRTTLTRTIDAVNRMQRLVGRGARHRREETRSTTAQRQACSTSAAAGRGYRWSGGTRRGANLFELVIGMVSFLLSRQARSLARGIGGCLAPRTPPANASKILTNFSLLRQDCDERARAFVTNFGDCSFNDRDRAWGRLDGEHRRLCLSVQPILQDGRTGHRAQEHQWPTSDAALGAIKGGE
jgi:hypothetical protein